MIGENMISVLLIQDVLAILVLIGLKAAGSEGPIDVKAVGYIVMGMVAFCLFHSLGSALWWCHSFSVLKRTGIFVLVALAWCFSMSDLAHHFNLSHEIGAFIAEVSIASTSNVSLYLAECLKPLRDFFLVLFLLDWGAVRPYINAIDVYACSSDGICDDHSEASCISLFVHLYKAVCA